MMILTIERKPIYTKTTDGPTLYHLRVSGDGTYEETQYAIDRLFSFMGKKEKKVNIDRQSD